MQRSSREFIRNFQVVYNAIVNDLKNIRQRENDQAPSCYLFNYRSTNNKFYRELIQAYLDILEKDSIDQPYDLVQIISLRSKLFMMREMLNKIKKYRSQPLYDKFTFGMAQLQFFLWHEVELSQQQDARDYRDVRNAIERERCFYKNLHQKYNRLYKKYIELKRDNKLPVPVVNGKMDIRIETSSPISALSMPNSIEQINDHGKVRHVYMQRSSREFIRNFQVVYNAIVNDLKNIRQRENGQVPSCYLFNYRSTNSKFYRELIQAYLDILEKDSIDQPYDLVRIISVRSELFMMRETLNKIKKYRSQPLYDKFTCCMAQLQFFLWHEAELSQQQDARDYRDVRNAIERERCFYNNLRQEYNWLYKKYIELKRDSKLPVPVVNGKMDIRMETSSLISELSIPNDIEQINDHGKVEHLYGAYPFLKK